MRTLDELRIVKDFLIEINKFENVREYSTLEPEAKIEKYLINIVPYELHEEYRNALKYYKDNIRDMHFVCTITVGLMSNLIMYLTEEEASEYTRKCAFSDSWYLKEDMTELEENKWVHNEYVNRFVVPLDDTHYHLIMNCTEVSNGYVYSTEYRNEHYKLAYDTGIWELNEDVTEVRYAEDWWSNNEPEIRYIKSQEYLNDNYVIPEDQEYYVNRDECIYIESTDNYVFDREYLDDNYNYCDECNLYYPQDTGAGEWLERYDRWVCNDCLEENYSICCDECGERIRNGDEYYVEDEEGDEETLCPDCYRQFNSRREDSGNVSELIGGYHHNHGVWKEYKLDDEVDTEANPLTKYGYELEVEPGRTGKYNVTKAAKAALENINCILSHDGSLNTDGFEIVSQPQSYNYVMSKFDTYNETFKKIIEAGYVSHNSTHCGLHFHVTAPKQNRDTIVARLWLIIESYKEEFAKLSRRKGDFSWCQFLSDRRYYGNNDNTMKSVYKIAKVSKEAKDDTRYLVINDRNENTIEIRLFRGTLNALTFYADFQLVHNLFRLAYDLTKPLTEITFKDLIEGEFIERYCRDNDIWTEKEIVDESDKYLEVEKKIINLTKNVLDITWRYIEELKSEQNKIIDKKSINKVQSYESSDKTSTIIKRLNSATQYYISLLNSYRETNVSSIMHRIGDILPSLQNSGRAETCEIIRKKIKKIEEYSKQI